ncbi:TonB-dependent receptor [Fulvivirga sp. M361]|uniref:TonB-dependent receptor n=1 Tax=Fulvivirga sp. M361 TaxID=2594266 RepID=UPI00117A2566|nr:TonB-dependent receptor [Fulvivirga sp. M361]TRX52409.1 TonB-dependent receptor [Fulvivirga sp. M361]
MERVFPLWKSLIVFVFCLLSLNHFSLGQQKFTLNGYVKDEANGEALIGATVLVKELGTGTATNVYGFYSITLGPGVYTLEYSYLGFDVESRSVSVESNQRLDIELTAGGTELQEVVITAEAEDENVTSVDMSTNKLDVKTIQKIPAFLGEVDVLRSIQLLPGVSSVGEGSSGFNVRGGSVGQNLVLLDDAPVYNSSHLFGFFSVFNPDAVKDIKLIKGGMPANYGGRLSSILDVRMKEGNSKDLEVSGGVGTVFSRLAVQGPIKKDKASFLVAGRRSYVDILARPFIDDATLYFYDLTTKVNYDLNDKNKLFLSGYFGRDVFRFDEEQGFDWGSITGTLRWNHLFNDRLFSNFAFFVSTYDYGFSFGENDLDKFDWSSRILTYTFKPSFNYFINNNNELLIGGEAILYDFKPAEAQGVSDGVVTDISLDEKYSLETAIYVANTQKLSSRTTLKYGLRLSGFQFMGPGNIYEYRPVEPGRRQELVEESTFQADQWEVVESYYNLEPRFSIRQQVGKGSVKASYTRTSQYIHLVSNTSASTPIDLWTPSSNNIEPQISDQFGIGYFKNFGKGNAIEASVEAYYRDNKNQVEFVKGADLFLNEFLEGDLISGDGRAYGLEFSVKKNSGKLNGWVSYTLGRSELQVEGINRGEWYPTRFDQTHNLKIFGSYNLSARTSFSGNFTYISGAPVTAPTSRFTQQGLVVPFDFYDSRNDFRVPATHRLDLSLTIQMKREKRGKERKNKDELVISLYNVYGRRNPFSIFFSQADGTPMPGAPVETQASRFSIVGAPVPSISYNFKF